MTSESIERRRRPTAPGRRLAGLAAVLVLVAAVAAGCTANPATGRGAFTAFMSEADEVKIGAAAHPELVAEYGGPYPDPRLQAYVSGVGQRIVAVTERPERAYTFVVLDDASVNAFALPGGYVHVTRGLVALAGSEAELAGVLAHEIGHLIARHPAERFSQAVAVGMDLARGGDAGSPTDGSAAAGRAALRRWTRDQEIEADVLAVRYLQDAGYDPAAIAGFLGKLASHAAMQSVDAAPDAGTGGLLATHPRTLDRVARAAAAAAAERPRGEAPADDYLDHVDGLVWGDDPRHGLRVGREFRHPELAIAFRVPEGFRLVNRPSHVAARGPNGSLMLFDMVPPPAARRTADLAAYVAGDWGGSLGLRDVRPLEINGMDAATGANRIRLENDLVDVRLVAVRERPGRTYRFMFLSPAFASDRLDPDFRTTTLSFRRLSEAEVAAVEPVRIRVETVRHGQAVADFAARMAHRDRPEDWFRVINGLAEADTLEPGRRVKVIRR